MHGHKYIVFSILILLVAGCSSPKTAAVADSRYRRQPIHEVSQQQLDADGRLIDALGRQESGHTDEALEAYAKLAHDVPQYAAAWYQMSRLLGQRGWTDSALACASRAAELVPDNRWYLLNLAETQRRSGQATQAVATWERIVKLDPNDLDNYYQLSNACLEAGDAEGAVDALNRVERKVGVTEPISLQKQRIWATAGKLDRAERELVTLADAMPQEKRYNAILAEMYMSQKKYAKAKQRYDRVLAADPDDQYIHIQLAEYYKQTGHPAEADSEMVLAFRNPALDASTKMQLLGSFYTNEEFFGSHSQTAFRLMDIAMAQADNPAQYAAFYGQVLFRQQKYADAARQFEVALNADSSRYEVWELLLVSLTEVPARENDLAAYAARAARLFPMQTLPHYLTALALAQQGNHAEALTHLETTRRWGYNKGYLEAECTSLTAECLYRTGRHDECWKTFDRYLELRPDDWGVINNYAWYLAEQGIHLDKALEMSHRTIEAEPQNANSLDTYGWILHLLGRDADALPYLERALRINPDNQTFRSHYNALKK